MKIIFTKLLLLISITNLLGQTFFEVEGKKVLLAELTKGYQFAFKFKDSSNLFLIDSVVTLSNFQKTIVKEIKYSNIRKENYTIINYSKIYNGYSFSKHFDNGKLRFIYETQVDSLNNVIYHKREEYLEDSTHRTGSEACFYYKDSLTSEGKIRIQTCFSGDAFSTNLIEFRKLIFFDKRNRIMKEVDNMDSTLYFYDEKDSLISKKYYSYELLDDGYEELIKTKHINSPCDSEYVCTFDKTDFETVKKEILKLLFVHKNYLTNYDCNECLLSFISNDSLIKLIIHRQKRYSLHGEELIYFTITQKY